MGLGADIRKLIEDAMLSAYIVSPRFDDYKITSMKIGDLGLENAIDEQVKKTSKQEGKGDLQGNDKTGLVDPLKSDSIMQHLKKLGVDNPKAATGLLLHPEATIEKGVISAFQRRPNALGFAMIPAMIVAVFAIIPEIIKWLTGRGGIFDLTFRDDLTTLVNRYRTIEKQQGIRVGFNQVIFTSRAGTPYERDSYNTYVQVNEGNRQADLFWSIRDPYGVNP